MDIQVFMKSQSVDTVSLSRRNPKYKDKTQFYNSSDYEVVFNSHFITTIPVEMDFLEVYDIIQRLVEYWGYKTQRTLAETEQLISECQSDEEIEEIVKQNQKSYHDIKLARDIDKTVWTFQLMTYDELKIWEDSLTYEA